MTLVRLLIELFPRFITEDVVANEVDGQYEIVCRLDDIFEEETFEYVLTVRSFAFLGIGFFPTVIQQRPFRKARI